MIDKIRRTPPRGRPATKDSVSRRSRSNSSKRDRSRSTNSVFRVPRTNSFSSQISSSQRSDSAAKKRKKEDSPPPKDAEKPKTQTEVLNVSNITKNSKNCAKCLKTFLKDDSSIECECCENWYHAGCQDLTEEAITAFKFLGDQASYFCLNCKAGAKVLFKGMQRLQDRMDNVDKEVSDIKTKVNNANTTSKNNATKLKTLETVHSTLKTEVDTLKNQVKTIQHTNKTHAEDNIKLQTLQQANSACLSNVATRLTTIEDDIIKRIHNIIDNRVDTKVKELKSEDAPIVINDKIDDDKLEDMVNKKINEKLTNDKDILSETISTKVNETVSNVYSDNLPTVPNGSMEVDGDNPANIKIPQTFTTAVHMVSREREEQQRRKLQLVITNLKETNTENDKNQVGEIFNILGVTTNIGDVMRLGTRKPGKNRVLRVSLDNMADKRTILAKATTLRNLPKEHKFYLVYIKPNLTPLQQQESKNLWIQLQEVKKKDPTNNYKISQRKIVKVPVTTPPPPPAQ